MDLLFDLDGTLTDPERGITGCIQHAIRKLGREPAPREGLRRYIGPPLRRTFAELLATDDPARIDSAIAHYRERFAEIGMYENEVYPDVRKSLAALRQQGHRLWVATSKPEVYARRIVQHFALTSLFQGVYGSELTGERSEKTELISHIMRYEVFESGQVCMIGDRAQDIEGGRANGTRTVGVLWGFGSETELRSAGPDILVNSMPALVVYIGDMQDRIEPGGRDVSAG